MSQRTRSNRQGDTNRRQRRNVMLAAAAILATLVLCSSATLSSVIWFANTVFDGQPGEATPVASTWATDSAELAVAVSPVMAPVLADLAEQFNRRAARTADGQIMAVRVAAFEPETMVDAALGSPSFQAMSPDSSLWLDQLEQRWAELSETAPGDTQIPIGRRRISEQVRYAVSPVVIAAWESVARELGWPDRPVGWQDIQQQATEVSNFKWNHSSTNNAAGLLATLAEFYAGAGLTRGLTEEAATAPETLAYVQAVESTVRFYGEGEEVIVERLKQEGRNFLDAFVAQERVVIDWNRHQPGERLVAIYPAEGTLWTDHPLALLDLGNQPGEPAVTDNQQQTFKAFADFLKDAEAQRSLLDAGYRPADLSIELDAPGSPFAATDAVDWRQPQTTLQMPPPAVIQVIRDFWYYTKRPTNVYLVVDTSGSMEGAKLARTREAVAAFVNEIKGSRDKVGLLEFASGSKSFTPLRPMDDRNRRDLLSIIDQMEAYGGTALLDAVYAATSDLLAQQDAQAINAIVVMTDGQENESVYALRDLERLVRQRGNVPLVIFTIAFGSDADERTLVEVARIGNGQFRRADETDIEELYRIVSTYF